jgi:hypothetical protein
MYIALGIRTRCVTGYRSVFGTAKRPAATNDEHEHKKIEIDHDDCGCCKDFSNASYYNY